MNKVDLAYNVIIDSSYIYNRGSYWCILHQMHCVLLFEELRSVFIGCLYNHTAYTSTKMVRIVSLCGLYKNTYINFPRTYMYTAAFTGKIAGPLRLNNKCFYLCFVFFEIKIILCTLINIQFPSQNRKILHCSYNKANGKFSILLLYLLKVKTVFSLDYT